MRKVEEVEFLIFLKDIAKQTINIENLLNQNKNQNILHLEIDLEYPKESQELHNDCRLAPDEIEIKTEMLSEYQLKIADLNNIHHDNVKKLVSNFSDKEKYVIHYEDLQLYLILGLKQEKYVAY